MSPAGITNAFADSYQSSFSSTSSRSSTSCIDSNTVGWVVSRIGNVIDQLKDTRRRAGDKVEKLTEDLKQLHQDNPDFRPWGLRGTDARRHAARGIKYKSRGELSLGDIQRKQEARKVGVTTRNQIKGLAILKDIFDEQEHLLRQQLHTCEEMTEIIEQWQDGGIHEEDQMELTGFEENAALAVLKIIEVEEMFGELSQKL